MAVTIELGSDLQNYLLSVFPPRSSVFRALAKATVSSIDLDDSAVTYEIACTEDVAREILSLAQQHGPDEVKQIDFALRIARTKETQLPLGWFRG